MKNRINRIEVHPGARRTFESPIEGSRGGWRTEHVKMKVMNDERTRKSQHSDDNGPQMTWFLGGGHTTGMWDLSFPAREQTCASTLGAWSLNHWATREVPVVPKWDKNETKRGRDNWTKIVEIKLSELQKKWTTSAQSTSQTQEKRQGKVHSQIKYSSSQDCQN